MRPLLYLSAGVVRATTLAPLLYIGSKRQLYSPTADVGQVYLNRGERHERAEPRRPPNLAREAVYRAPR